MSLDPVAGRLDSSASLIFFSIFLGLHQNSSRSRAAVAMRVVGAFFCSPP